MYPSNSSTVHKTGAVAQVHSGWLPSVHWLCNFKILNNEKTKIQNGRFEFTAIKKITYQNYLLHIFDFQKEILAQYAKLQNYCLRYLNYIK